MPIIQILLILAVMVIFIFFLRHHGTTRTAAGFKVGFLIFVAFGLTAVLWPTGVSRVAKMVGVGRGTDLLLYALVVAFAFYSINTYLRFKEVDLRYARLVRAMALREAEAPPTQLSPTASPTNVDPGKPAPRLLPRDRPQAAPR